MHSCYQLVSNCNLLLDMHFAFFCDKYSIPMVRNLKYSIFYDDFKPLFNIHHSASTPEFQGNNSNH